jgi:hypothetical protein
MHEGMIPQELLIRVMRSSPEQQAAIRHVLDEVPSLTQPGPLLTNMSSGARRLGVSRGTLWRMCKAGILERVELAPGVVRLRCADLEALAAKKSVNARQPRSPAQWHRKPVEET